MKSFKEFLIEEKNPIPVGQYDSDKKMNVGHLVAKVERSKPRTNKIDVKTLVDLDIIKATQHTINDRNSYDDPVFPEYEDKPVLVNYGDYTYILDGHHRMAKAYKSNSKLEVYLFD
jgi:hypothetical protein